MSESTKLPRRKIRLIVDEGAVQCPICRLPVVSGMGHQCTQEGVTTSSINFRLTNKEAANGND